MRTCRKCGVEKPLEQFRQSKPGYRRRVCNECMDRAAVEWQQQNRERLLAWRKANYQQNQAKNIAKAQKWNAENSGQQRRNNQKRYHRLREAVFMAYGGYECACCGENERMFLTIDHVENDQCEYAKKYGRPHTGGFLYKWLADNNFPADFQVLCHNCNQGKRLNGGVCPHRVNKA